MERSGRQVLAIFIIYSFIQYIIKYTYFLGVEEDISWDGKNWPSSLSSWKSTEWSSVWLHFQFWWGFYFEIVFFHLKLYFVGEERNLRLMEKRYWGGGWGGMGGMGRTHYAISPKFCSSSTKYNFKWKNTISK